MSEGLFDVAPMVEREIERMERIQAQIHGRAGQIARNPRYQLESLAGMSRKMSVSLDSMLTLAKQLADAGSGESPTSRAETIYSAGSQLRDLIDHILDLARIESGDAALDIGAERIADLGKYFEQAYRPVAEADGLTFEIEIESDLPAAIKTDGKRLRQILDNLLSNAFRCTERGGVTLRMASVQRGGMPSGEPSACKWVEFSVVDTGIGISEDRQESIFEPFQRNFVANSHGAHGNGLGLFTCRQLAHLLGGELSVASAAGMGSRFTLLLPLLARTPVCNNRMSPKAGPVVGRLPREMSRDRTLPAMPGAQQPADAEREEGVDHGNVVLVVADDVQFATLMLGQLRSEGYQADAVIGLEALEEGISKRAPAAIIFGMTHHENDCLTVFDLLRHGATMPGVPISMICRDSSDIHKCFEFGGHRVVDDCGNASGAATPKEVLRGLSAIAGSKIAKVLVADAAESLCPDIGAAWRLDGTEAVVFGTGALIADALRYGSFDGMVLGATLMDMSSDELIKRLFAAEFMGDLPIAIVGMARDVNIAMLKRRNGFAAAMAETARFLHRAMPVEVH